MDTLTAMSVFAAVVDNNSLAGAARAKNISPSVVSKQLAALEDRLGVRLLNRTTRRISLTEVGSAYYDRCKRIWPMSTRPRWRSVNPTRRRAGG